MKRPTGLTKTKLFVAIKHLQINTYSSFQFSVLLLFFFFLKSSFNGKASKLFVFFLHHKHNKRPCRATNIRVYSSSHLSSSTNESSNAAPPSRREDLHWTQRFVEPTQQVRTSKKPRWRLTEDEVWVGGALLFSVHDIWRPETSNQAWLKTSSIIQTSPEINKENTTNPDYIFRNRLNK